jgi:hypothetical protein
MEEKECTLSDQELVRKVDEWNGKLCRTKGGAWCLSIPPNLNSDPDMLIAELCKRFERIISNEQVRKDYEESMILSAADLTWKEEMENETREQNKVLDILRTKVSDEFFKEIQFDLNESGYTHSFKIVDTPIGDILESVEYYHIKEIYVNQTVNGGYTGDEYEGTVSIKISENEYFQFSYSM